MKNLLKYSLVLLLVVCGLGCSQMTKFTAWEFKEAGAAEWMPAEVPGTVHTDLLANQKIPDPFVGTNELKLQWIETKDWDYQTTFQPSTALLKNEAVDLIFEGLDTYAKVYLNDSLIIESDNMYVAWSAEVKRLLRKKDNKLEVRFKSPVTIGQQKLEELPYLIPASNEALPVGQQNSIFSRKAQYHFGWDWGPRLVTSGIYRAVKLKGRGKGKIERVKIDVDTIEASAATCLVTITTSEGLVNPDYKISFEGPEIKTALLESKANEVIYKITVANPKVWWPVGMGAQPLYPVKVDLLSQGKKVDSYQTKIGLRKVAFVQEADSVGRSFYFTVNDLPVFMKGANYIPADFFNPRAATRYDRVIQNALDANMNMLRIWGGAIYEDEAFYSLCDEKGILIWQDFMFACAMVPTQQHHLENIKREAKSAVSRLHNHPSVILWCGNNENLTGWNKWGWQDSYNLHGADSLAVWNTYDSLFNHVLPAYVEKYGNNNYWASSPSSGLNQLENKESGDQHAWSVWFGQKPFSHFEEDAGRFISEYGLQSFPEMSTIKQFDPALQEWDLETPALNFRQRSKMNWIKAGFDGFDMMRYYLDLYFPAPRNLEDFVFLSQLTQAHGLQTGIEAHRKNKPYTMGSLYWQIDDVWPTISWSTVDYYGAWKAGHYAVREANKPIIVCGTESGDRFKIQVISDQKTPFSGKLELKLIHLKGPVLSQRTVDVQLDGLENKIVLDKYMDRILEGNLSNEVVLQMVLTKGDEVIDEGLHYFVSPKDLKLEPVAIEMTVEGDIITLESDYLAKGVYLSVENETAHFSDNYFDLLPGVKKQVEFKDAAKYEYLLQAVNVQTVNAFY